MMSGRILHAMLVVLTCYVHGQKHGKVSADADSSDLANRLQNLEAQLQKQDEINNKQAEAIAEQAAFMASQADINSQQADQLQKQAELFAIQSGRIADLELENQKQAGVIAEQNERIAGIELEQSQQDNIVAFTASASVTRVYNAGERVLFDTVLTSYGDSYDSVTSIFTCSVSGYYLFSVAVLTDGDSLMHAQIQLDDNPLVAAYSYEWEAGSNMVVTYCAKDQAVWVMCAVGQGELMFEDGYRWSTFSGTLLTMG